MNVEYFVRASAKLSHQVRNDLKLHYYLYQHIDDIDLFIKNGEPLRHAAIIHTIQLSLKSSLIMQLSDYLSKADSKNTKIDKLLKFAASNCDKIPWKTPPARDWIGEQSAKIEMIGPAIRKLRIVRNEYFAHIDNDHLLDPDTSLKHIIPTTKEMLEILITIESILISIDRHLGRMTQLSYGGWFDAECREFKEKLLANVVSGGGDRKKKVMGCR